eukprot:144711-Prymnesium_polylepis.2
MSPPRQVSPRAFSLERWPRRSSNARMSDGINIESSTSEAVGSVRGHKVLPAAVSAAELEIRTPSQRQMVGGAVVGDVGGVDRSTRRRGGGLDRYHGTAHRALTECAQVALVPIPPQFDVLRDERGREQQGPRRVLNELVDPRRKVPGPVNADEHIADEDAAEYAHHHHHPLVGGPELILTRQLDARHGIVREPFDQVLNQQRIDHTSRAEERRYAVGGVADAQRRLE